MQNKFVNSLKTDLWVSQDTQYRLYISTEEIQVYFLKEKILTSSYTLRPGFNLNDRFVVQLADAHLIDDAQNELGVILKLNYQAGFFLMELAKFNQIIAFNPTYRIRYTSYEGGGPTYSVTLSNDNVSYYYHAIHFSHMKDPALVGTGSRIDINYYFFGLKPGLSTIKIYEDFLSEQRLVSIFDMRVDDKLLVDRAKAN